MPRFSINQRLPWRFILLATIASTMLWPVVIGEAGAQAADVAKKPARDKSQASEPAATVEMFAGMKSGDIDVKLIAMDSTKGNVMITNKTKKPLTVQLPKAFAGVPVLAQRGNAGGLGGGGGVGGMGGMNQGMGGGMGGGMMGGGMMGGGGMGMGGMGMGGMGGFMNIAPEKTTKFKVPLVCLEHGKKDPRPSVPYEIVPIDSFTKNASVQQLCAMLGEGKLDQRVAQVAAWNLANGLSFEELAAKRLEVFGSAPQPYFSMAEVQAAVAIVGEAQGRAAQAAKDAKKDDPTLASPGEAQNKANGQQAANDFSKEDDSNDEASGGKTRRGGSSVGAVSVDPAPQKSTSRRKGRSR